MGGLGESKGAKGGLGGSVKNSKDETSSKFYSKNIPTL